MTTAGGPPLRVLLVDDMEMTAQALSRFLASEGYVVQIANGIASAERFAAAGTFDLVISDLSLPDGSGIDVLTRVRIKAGRPDLPGIILSGISPLDVEKVFAAGYVACLSKPCDVDELLATVREVVLGARSS